MAAGEEVRRSPRKHSADAAGEMAPSKRSKTADPVGSLLILRDPEPNPALREKAAKCENACYCSSRHASICRRAVIPLSC